MKLPDGFYKSLILLLLAILIAYLLSFFVLPLQTATKANLSDILVKGPAINEETNYSLVLIKWLFAFLTAFATVKGYEYWKKTSRHPIHKNPEDLSSEMKQYKETLNTISSLEAKSAPPKLTKRKKGILKNKNKNKSTRFSSKQTRKIIDSSRSLSEFMVAE